VELQRHIKTKDFSYPRKQQQQQQQQQEGTIIF